MKYNMSKIMRRAWELVKKIRMTISEGLKKAWREAKAMTNAMKNVVVEHFESYNERRYSTPWVCLMTEEGNYDFSKRVGTYTAGKGCSGDLVVHDPVIGQVYGYGQKDYRGNKTILKWVKWTGCEFTSCDKLGNN